MFPTESKGQLIGYWVATGLLALTMLSGAYVDITQPDDVVKLVTDLGYPLYFLTMLGVFKALGSITILLPGLPRLKEWAYAGFAIDLVAAFVSHKAVGDSMEEAGPPLAVLAIALTSWYLRPANRRL